MALTEEHKHKLELLRAQWPGGSNQEDIDSLEKDLADLLENKESLDLPVFKKFAARAQEKTNSLNALLLNDRSLLNEKGIALSQERDLWGAILSSFGLSATNEAVKALEELIDTKIIIAPYDEV